MQLPGGAGLMRDYYKEIGDILGSGGAAYSIIPIGDPLDEAADKTTVTTRGAGAGNGLVFTYSEARSAFDNALRYKGIRKVPIQQVNGTDEEADSPDAAYWSRVSAVFSVGAWVNMVDATGSVILAKYDSPADREWQFALDGSDKLTLVCYDESAVDPAFILSADDTNFPQGVWVFAVGTYNGSADATGINLYRDGALIASTDTDSANFIALEDLTSTVQLGFRLLTPENLFDGSIAGGPLGPFYTQRELSASDVWRLFQIGRSGLLLPRKGLLLPR